MAAKSVVLNKTLALECNVGVDGKGKEIIKKQRFKNLKVTLSENEILAVGKAIESLLGTTVAGMLLEQDSQIVSE
ncbi:Protein of unknown function [Hathewaya proteolytica DSM 3090]|uniref:DUF1659 domain-containing protein n=1 Tax=Hathewaya proteolytica DSM 3090 TaxID=1121331 RepID=A0A1M6R549_9CLOT|nr:DUF1659 domain-containing protein [Hathewaya proteolytica]SHK27457.1 Protein of unknown function [Hathewaya proteolytica DSM 3090]